MTDTGAAALAGNFDRSDEQVRLDRPAVYAELRRGPPRWSDACGEDPTLADCCTVDPVTVESALDRSGRLATC
ncbi:MAG: hypothetical protein QOJ56_6503 [Mycobacterium sp.]|jgi:hypothetical protein|nr:hypothetical protein [Actinomycetota bacterium]MDT5357971.1 hypothetical protein [Mycobacterium sp.]